MLVVWRRQGVRRWPCATNADTMVMPTSDIGLVASLWYILGVFKYDSVGGVVDIAPEKTLFLKIGKATAVPGVDTLTNRSNPNTNQ